MRNKNRYIINTCMGITVVEVLAILFILGVLLAITISPLSKFRENKLVNVNSEDVFSMLNVAKLNTLTAKNGFQYGVRIEAGKVSLFTGNIFSAPAVIEEIVLHNSVSISQISLNGGGSDIIFDKLTGGTSQFGSFVIQSKKDTSVFHSVIIEKTGIITLM